MDWVPAVAIAMVLALITAYAAGRTARYAGRQGWVYNKHNPRPPGSGAPMLIEQIYQPSIEHVVDELASERIRADQSESGQGREPKDPPA